MKRILLLLVFFSSLSLAQLDTVKNFAIGRLSAGASSTDTLLLLTSGNGARFGYSNYNLIVWDYSVYGYNYTQAYLNVKAEIVRVTANSGDTLTVTRAQEGTSAVNFNSTGHVYYVQDVATGKMFLDISDSITALNDSITALRTAVSQQSTAWLQTQQNGNLTGNATRYMPPIQGSISTGSGSFRYYFSRGVTLTGLTVSAQTTLATTVTVTVYKGTGTGSSSATTQTTGSISISAGSFARGSDFAHPISVSAGDWIEYQIVCGTNAPTVYVVSELAY